MGRLGGSKLDIRLEEKADNRVAEVTFQTPKFLS